MQWHHQLLNWIRYPELKELPIQTNCNRVLNFFDNSQLNALKELQTICSLPN